MSIQEDTEYIVGLLVDNIDQDTLAAFTTTRETPDAIIHEVDLYRLQNSLADMTPELVQRYRLRSAINQLRLERMKR